ncbi:MAG: glycosyltransferase [Lysobacter sp.]|nr:glycosyltransferase [Lysobacter sp.]
MMVRESDVAILEASELFDAEQYAARHPDVAMQGVRPAEHYLRVGAKLLRNPGDGFDTAYYVASNPDVARSALNPLLHYLAFGRSEGRPCVPPPPAASAEPENPARERLAAKAYQELAGFRAPLPAAKTVLVCAHVSGKHLFGGERSLLDVLDGVHDSGYNVVVTTPGGSNDDYLRLLRERCTRVISFQYGWWRRNMPVNEHVVSMFASVIAQHGVDAVHANTIMLREPLLAARRIGIPAVVHVRELIAHDAALLDLIGEEPGRIVDQVIDAADWIIANSEATAGSFAKAGATQIVPNTIDTEAFDIDPPGRTALLNVAIVSSNLPKKGVLDLVEVAHLCRDELPDARFLLIGPDNEHIAGLKRMQQAGEISPNIVFAGYREHSAEAMAEADIVLNLSHFQESFGRTVLEAMAARRPTIVYDWGALPELVVHGHTGFVVPFKDVAAVVDKLKVLYDDREQLREMGEAARQRALALYAKDHYANRMGAAYAEIFHLPVTPSALTLPARDGSAAAKAAEPLRIAYFLWHFPVPSETFVLNELRILVARGHDVQVFCKQSPHKDFQPDFPIQWKTVQDPADLARQLVDSGRNMVHSHFTYPTVTEMVWPACEQAKIPFTFIAHAQDIFRKANDEKNKIGLIGKSPWCLRVLVPSRFHRDYVESRGVPAEKLMINPNGIDPDLYVQARDTGRAARSRRSVCAIHRFTEKKGLEDLIRAGKSLAQDGISIHIHGYGHLEQRYRDLIAQEHLENVFLHGPVESREEMLQVFRGHDLFACPSVRADDGDMDGIPTVLMEAMASGLPVLATGISGIPDLVRDELTGIVCQGGAASIADAIKRFYAMPEGQVRAIIEDAQALIERDFNAARLTSALLRLWQRRTIDVMIVSWNNPAQLQEVIRRLRKFTSLPFHLIICDNGSAPQGGALLCDAYSQYANLTVVFNRNNALVGPGTNICLQHGHSDYAVYVCGKEGFVLDYGWEKTLIEYMDANPAVGLGGTLCHSPSYFTGSMYPTGVRLFGNFRNQSYAAENPDRPFAHVQGGFMVIRRAMFDQIGGFSDEVPHDYTDVEYSYYAESRGWSLGQAPGMLALYNKTRPGIFTRLDESIAAIHPPTLDDLPLLDSISARTVRHCSLCHWHGEAFAGPAAHPQCPQCGADPADRSLYRFLAESTLTYRRLPAFGVGLGAAILPIWRQQFQGGVSSPLEFQEKLAAKAGLGFASRGMKVVYLDLAGIRPALVAAGLSELVRLLADDGILVLHPGNEADPHAEQAMQDAAAHGLALRDRVRYTSGVGRYDWRPLLVLSREKPCAS